MSFVGKIFVVLILILSVVYMGFAMAVYSAHRNWRAVVERSPEETPAGEEIGLRYQVEQALSRNKELAEQINRLNAQIDAERRAISSQQAKLITERDRLLDQSNDLRTQHDALLELNRKMSGNVEATQTIHSQTVKEVERLRSELRSSQQERDTAFQRLVSRTEQVHDALGKLTTLRERNGDLAQDLSRYKRAFTEKGLRLDDPSNRVGVDGLVTAVQKEDLIEVSIGSDDGLQVGQTLEVYRQQTYLGRAQIIRTRPDKAVAKMIKGTRTGPIQQGDRVATRLRLG